MLIVLQVETSTEISMEMRRSEPLLILGDEHNPYLVQDVEKDFAGEADSSERLGGLAGLRFLESRA